MHEWGAWESLRFSGLAALRLCGSALEKLPFTNGARGKLSGAALKRLPEETCGTAEAQRTQRC